MTALSKYEKLECTGLWRTEPGAQRREVFVSFGAATLVLSDKNETVLSHWSLPAIKNINPGERPAVFSPTAEAGETLELSDSDMIGAIEKIRAASARHQPRAGRLRLILTGFGVAVVIALGVFWLPTALIRQTARVVPEAKRAEIGRELLANITHLSGQPCNGSLGKRALLRLNNRLRGTLRERLVVVPSGVAQTLLLPGRIILLNRSLVEDYEGPEVVAGFILAEQQRAEDNDPLEKMLRSVGLMATLRLLTTGIMSTKALETYAEHQLTLAPATVDTEALLERFENGQISAAPYAYALDISGESTLGLIEADPYRDASGNLVLSDDAWVSLQGICGE